MKLKNIVIPLMIFGSTLISCEEEETNTETITRQETTNCREVNFEFNAEQSINNEILISINAPLEPLTEGITYQWDITETIDNQITTIEDVVGGDNAFAWEVNEGLFEFCLTTTSETCTEGVSTCKTLVVTEENVEDSNSTNFGSISVIPTSSNSYSLKIDRDMDSSTCEAVDFELEARQSTNNKIIIDLNAPLAAPNELIMYRWDITETRNNEITTIEDVVGGDNIFGWEVSEGIFEFCLTTTSETCTEGESICKTLTVTEENVEQLNSENFVNINTILAPDGNYKLEINLNEATINCEAVDFELGVRNGFTSGLFLSLYAPLSSNTGLEDVTYRWSITQTINGETILIDDIDGGDNVASFELINAGTFEICLNTSHLGCTEGIATCKTLVISGNQFDDANTNVSSIEEIIVVSTQNDNFTIEVIRN